MVFNQKARDLIAFCGAAVNVPSHDGWLYQVAAACDGYVHYDAHPAVRYRRHAHNVSGANMSWAARMHRLHLCKGAFPPLAGPQRGGADTPRLRPRMSEENRRIFDLFRKAHDEPLLRRVIIFAPTGV
jgi:hypothetical protein